MSYDEVLEKARSCAIYGGGRPVQADRLAEIVSRLDSLDDVGPLTRLLG